MNYSQQREEVLRAVKENAVHPTADTVCQIVQSKNPKVGIATVYRNLKVLAELGEIKRIASDGGDRYDGNTSGHQHFICKECGGVFDISLFKTEPKRADGHRIDDLQVAAYGICKNCLSNK